MTAINKTIADIQAKVADAGTQSTSASSAVTVLVPDNGNAATVTSNTKALQSARAMIKTATADLKAARTDTDSIKTALTAMGQ